MSRWEHLRIAWWQWHRPALTVRCPLLPPYENVLTARSTKGPMCSNCGALIDRSPKHVIVCRADMYSEWLREHRGGICW